MLQVNQKFKFKLSVNPKMYCSCPITVNLDKEAYSVTYSQVSRVKTCLAYLNTMLTPKARVKQKSKH